MLVCGVVFCYVIFPFAACCYDLFSLRYGLVRSGPVLLCSVLLSWFLFCSVMVCYVFVVVDVLVCVLGVGVRCSVLVV